MASHTLTRSLSAASFEPGALLGIYNRIAARVAEYRTYRDTLGELSRLSDRDLADLGLHRSGLRAISRQAARKNTAL